MINNIVYIVLKILKMKVISTIVILLGSHIDSLLKDRCRIVVDYFYDSSPNDKPYIYISGGNKHAVETQSESYLATNYISNSSSIMSDYIITDNEAKNTAENFRNFKCKYYNQNKFNDMPNIVIATSSFHYTRAKKIFDAYFPNYKGRETWLLGKKSCYYCVNDEKYHINNVDKDINKAPPSCLIV